MEGATRSSELQLRSVSEPPLQIKLQSSSTSEGDYIDGLAPVYTNLIPEASTNANHYTTYKGELQKSNVSDSKGLYKSGRVQLSNTGNAKQSVWSTPFIVITVLLFIILIVMVAILCMMAAHIACNRSLPDFNEWANGVSQNTLQLFQNNTNFTELDKQILQTKRDSAQKLINIVNTLSNLQDTSTSTAGVVDDILLIAQELLVLHNDSTALPTSCKEIKERQPLSPSGVYLLADINVTYTAYCNMDELCGSGGGWTRLAYLDMSDATQNCPSGFRLYQSGGVRACGRPVTNSGSCVSVQFPSNGIRYSQICGRVTGYQYGTPDAVHPTDGPSGHQNNISSYYADGVLITRGFPRQHVWTLIAGFTENSTFNIYSNCPCAISNNTTIVNVPSFIGSHYYCESGKNDTDLSTILCIDDALWDGQDCENLERPCCQANMIPWFHRDYGSTTTTVYIELRVCADEGTDNEDVPVSFYEIYIK